MVLRFHRLPSGGINISMQDALQNRLLIMPVEQGEKRKPTLLLKVNLLFIEGYSWFELSQWILEWQPSFWSVHGSLTVSRRTIRRLSWTSMISRKKKQRKMLPRCNCINFDERKAYSTIQKRCTQNLVTTHRELSEQNHFSNSFLFQTTFKKVSKLTAKCKFEGPFCFGGG